MLSAVAAAAAFVASPQYIIQAHLGPTINPAAQPGGQPQGQPANAPPPYEPQQIQSAYGVNLISFSGITGNGAGQTVAIVDAYDDPKIISDTAVFDSEFNLPQFNSAGGPTFKVLNENGGTTLPTTQGQGWDVEESLDVQWVHSVAPMANIILFEADTNGGEDLYTAEATAAGFAGVSVVSNSWGGAEFTDEQELDSIFTTPKGHQGVTFLSGAGDHDSPGLYPAYSPNVIAVGGTALNLTDDNQWLSETVWNNNNGNGTGGGISTQESQPSYQVGNVNGLSTTSRTMPDVAAEADPVTGVYVYDTFGGAGGWMDIGGTSLATPLWGGMIAIADQGRVIAGRGTLDGPTQTLPMLYGLPSADFHDVTVGNNGTYSALTGYDLVTGRGTPIANLLVPALAGYQTTPPPSITAPTSAGTAENTSLVFSAANNNQISVTDSSAGGNSDTLQLSVLDGTLTLATTSGLTFTSGSNDSASFTVTGTVPALNAALAGLIYQPTVNYVGPDTLSIEITDTVDQESASASVSLGVAPPVSGTWGTMTNPVPDATGADFDLLLPTGQVMVHSSISPSTWYSADSRQYRELHQRDMDDNRAR